MERKADYYIIGTHAIEEVVKKDLSRFKKIYTSDLEKDIILFLEKKKIPIQRKSKKELSDIVGTDSHQGIIASIKPPHFYDLKNDLEEKETSQLFIILDQIYDPHNFGAILRAAECFKITGIIWSKNRGVKLSPIVSKTSSGASELVKLFRVSNLVDAIQFLKKQDFEILCADISEQAENLFEYRFPLKTAIVLGSEGKGIQPLVRKNCDKALYIPMKGQIDSLNVSQASSIILSMWSMQVDQLKQ